MVDRTRASGVIFAGVVVLAGVVGLASTASGQIPPSPPPLNDGVLPLGTGGQCLAGYAKCSAFGGPANNVYPSFCVPSTLATWGCGTCSPPPNVERAHCEGGRVVIDQCKSGFRDNDKSGATGCEVQDVRPGPPIQPPTPVVPPSPGVVIPGTPVTPEQPFDFRVLPNLPIEFPAPTLPAATWNQRRLELDEIVVAFRPSVNAAYSPTAVSLRGDAWLYGTTPTRSGRGGSEGALAPVWRTDLQVTVAGAADAPIVKAMDRCMALARTVTPSTPTTWFFLRLGRKGTPPPPAFAPVSPHGFFGYMGDLNWIKIYDDTRGGSAASSLWVAAEPTCWTGPAGTRLHNRRD